MRQENNATWHGYIKIGFLVLGIKSNHAFKIHNGVDRVTPNQYLGTKRFLNLGSVTRFGEVSPLGQNFEGLFSVWQNLTNFSKKNYEFQVNLSLCKQPNNEKYSSHLVTLHLGNQLPFKTLGWLNSQAAQAFVTGVPRLDPSVRQNDSNNVLQSTTKTPNAE